MARAQEKWVVPHAWTVCMARGLGYQRRMMEWLGDTRAGFVIAAWAAGVAALGGMAAVSWAALRSVQKKWQETQPKP